MHLLVEGGFCGSMKSDFYASKGVLHETLCLGLACIPIMVLRLVTRVVFWK